MGTVVCKMGEHRNTFRGYIAMLVVIKPYRGRGIGNNYDFVVFVNTVAFDLIKYFHWAFVEKPNLNYEKKKKKVLSLMINAVISVF